MNDDSSDTERALDVLMAVWTGCDSVWIGHDGLWAAHYAGAGDDDIVTGATADELCLALFAEEMRRAAP
jgi:hypothetical protein